MTHGTGVSQGGGKGWPAIKTKTKSKQRRQAERAASCTACLLLHCSLLSLWVSPDSGALQTQRSLPDPCSHGMDAGMLAALPPASRVTPARNARSPAPPTWLRIAAASPALMLNTCSGGGPASVVVAFLSALFYPPRGSAAWLAACAFCAALPQLLLASA